MARTVAGRIRGLVFEAGISQEELAERVGLSSRAMSNRIHGKTPFRLNELEAIARELNTTVAALADSRAAS